MDTRISGHDGKRVYHACSESPEHLGGIKAGEQAVENMRPDKVAGGPVMFMAVEYDDEGLMSHGIMRAWCYGARII